MTEQPKTTEYGDTMPQDPSKPKETTMSDQPSRPGPIPLPNDLNAGDILAINTGEKVRFERYMRHYTVTEPTTEGLWIWRRNGRNVSKSRFVTEIIRAKPEAVPMEHPCPHVATAARGLNALRKIWPEPPGQINRNADEAWRALAEIAGVAT